MNGKVSLIVMLSCLNRWTNIDEFRNKDRWVLGYRAKASLPKYKNRLQTHLRNRRKSLQLIKTH